MPIEFDSPEQTKPKISFDDGKPESSTISFDDAPPAGQEGQSSIGTAIGGMAIETAAGMTGTALGGIVGGVLGGIGGTAAAPGAGTVAGGAAGAVYGASAGGAIGSAFGNWLKQQLEIHTGERKQVSGGQVVSSALIGAIPAAAGAKAIAKSTNILKPALIRAAQGGSAAAAGKLAEITIDEGKLPTPQRIVEEVVPAAVVGGALGGVMGGVEKAYQLKGGLIVNPVVAQGVRGATAIGTAAYTYNNAVESGDDNPLAKAVMYGVGTYALTGVPSALSKMDKNKVVQKVFGSEFVLPQEVVQLSRDSQNKLAAIRNEASTLGNLLNESISKSADPQALTADVIAAMDGKASSLSMPKDIRTYLERFNNLRSENSKLILEAYPNLDEQVKKAISNNEFSYIRTAYAAHDPRAKAGVDYATKEASDAFKAKLMGSGMSETEAEAVMARMRNDVAYVYSGGMDGKKTSPTSAFMQKGDLTPEAKAYLGEVKDPGRRLEMTLSTQGKLIMDDQRDDQLAKLLIGGKLASKAGGELVDPSHTTLLINAENPTYHNKLANLLVPEYVADAYKELMDPNLFGNSTISKGWMAIAGASKSAKTVGNLAESVSPQILGNIAMAASGGKANPVKIYDSFREIAQSYGWRGGNLTAEQKVKFASDVKKLVGLGVMKGGTDVQELSAFINEATKNKSVKGVWDKMSKIYGFPDSVLRYSIYKGELDELKRIRPAMAKTNLPELEKMAAINTNNFFPTYENIPRRYRQLSAATVANVFGAFEFEVMRNSMNQIRYAGQLIKEGRATGNTEMAKMGWARLLSFGMVAGTTVGLGVFGSRLAGTSQEKQEALQKVAPPFDSDKTNVYKLGKGDGKFSYVPINYLFPHANMLGAINEGLNGRNPLPYIKTSLMGNDLGPLATAGIESITNTYYGTKVPISEPRDPKALTERFVSRAFMPNFITGTLTRTEKALRGETSKLGAAPTMSDVGLRTLGYRQNTYDTLATATARIRDINDPITGELTGYRQILKKAQIQPGGMERLNEDAVYQQRAQGYAEGQAKLRDIYKALKVLQEDNGYSDDQIVGAFRQAGVPSRLIVAATMGFNEPMPRGLAESNTDIIHEILSTPEGRANPAKFIMARGGGDLIKTKQLLETFRTEKMAEATGADSYTKLFGGLDIADGQRARSIQRSIDSTRAQFGDEAAKSLYNKLIANKIITKEVAMQMRQMQPSAP